MPTFKVTVADRAHIIEADRVGQVRDWIDTEYVAIEKVGTHDALAAVRDGAPMVDLRDASGIGAPQLLEGDDIGGEA